MNNWILEPFGELANFKNGLNFRAGETGYSLKVLGVGDFKQRTKLDQVAEISSIHTDKKIDKSYLLQDGDLVFVRSNGNPALVGRCMLICTNNECISYSGFTIRARLNSDKTSPEFVSLLMQGGLLKDVLKRDGRGTNISNLNQEILSKLQIPLPPSKEQKKLLELFDLWDKAIEKTEVQINHKLKFRDSLANKLLFGKDRTLIQKNKATFHNEKWFKTPTDWSIVKIKNVANEIIEKNSCNTEYTVLSCSKYIGFVESLNYFKKKVYSDNTENYKIIRRGDFGYPSNHIEEGSIGLQNICNTGIVSPIYTVFRVDQEKVNPDYLYKLLKTNLYRHIFQASTSSSVDRRGSLRWKEFSKIEIPLPNIEEQTKIANTINVFDKEIVILKELLEKYRLQKRGLMQKLLTGEWQVPSQSTEEILKEVKT